MKNKTAIKRKKYTSEIDPKLDRLALAKAKKETGYPNRRYAIEKALKLWLSLTLLFFVLPPAVSTQSKRLVPNPTKQDRFTWKD